MFNLLFPGRCDLCLKELSCHEHIRICRKCIASLKVIAEERVCSLCAHPLRYNSCPSCCSLDLQVERNSSLFYNQGYEQAFLYSFKFKNKPSYASVIADLSVNYINFSEYDCLVPVPLNRHSLFRRDYCQVKTVAAIISRRTGIPFYDAVWKKDSRKDTAQHFKNRNARQKELKGCYLFKKKYRPKLEGRKILIVDDIFTTGSTINTVALELKKNLSNVNISSFTFARSLL